MVAGGQDLHSKLASVEFISATNESNLLPRLPIQIYDAPYMFLHCETIMVCGGERNLRTCLKLQDGTWTKYNSLKKDRSSASVVLTTKATYIFGGGYSQDTYEYLEKNASTWNLGERKIPGRFWQGCSIAISQDEIWLIGGQGSYTRILSFNVHNHDFTVLPIQLKQGRSEHQCAFIPNTRNIIVTGGYTYPNFFQSTEIIDVKNRNVTEGPPMNSKRTSHGIGILNINKHERVIVFGGYNKYEDYLKSVEVFNAQTHRWDHTNIELSEAKSKFGFMTIKSQP